MGTIASFAQTLNITGLFTNALDLTTPSESIVISQSQTLTNGTGSNQIGEIWHDTLTLVANTPQHKDLYGTLVNGFNESVEFATIKILYVLNKETTSGYDVILSGTFMDLNVLGGGASTIILGPGGVCLLTSPVDGFTVTDTTGERLTLNPGGNDVACDIVLVGTV